LRQFALAVRDCFAQWSRPFEVAQRKVDAATVVQPFAYVIVPAAGGPMRDAAPRVQVHTLLALVLSK